LAVCSWQFAGRAVGRPQTTDPEEKKTADRRPQTADPERRRGCTRAARRGLGERQRLQTTDPDRRRELQTTDYRRQGRNSFRQRRIRLRRNEFPAVWQAQRSGEKTVMRCRCSCCYCCYCFAIVCQSAIVVPRSCVVIERGSQPGSGRVWVSMMRWCERSRHD
jgi:hypothetical protein